MAENISKVLDARKEFIGHLEEDIKKTNQSLEETTKELDTLKESVENIKTLGKYPEHTALIPLGKKIFMMGKIVHTGEYYIKKPASPESYFVLKTLEQTINALEDQVKSKEKDIETIEYASSQLEERMRILKGDEEGIEVPDEELPKEIKSEKGVAVKVGEFYEILEFEED